MAEIVEPADVLRLQADLRDRTTNPYMARVISYQFTDLHGRQEMSGNISGVLRDSLTRARAYRVEQQMTDVLMRRAESLSDDETIGNPPMPDGFIVFESPLVMWDVSGRVEKIHYITWTTMEILNQIMISMWNDTRRDPDEPYTTLVLPEIESNPEYAEQIAAMGRWSMTNCGSIRPSMHVGPVKVPVTDRQRAYSTTYGGTPVEYTQSIYRVFSAMFAMLSERIPAANQHKAQLTRTERKQANRVGLEPEVILVTLRPEYKEPYEPGSGHPISVKYRMGDPDDPDSIAFYRTIHKGTPRERRIPVHSHWRGREDAPESTRKRVYNLAR